MDSEITIIGAGVIGSSLASLLSKQGVKVTLIDRGTPLNISKSSKFYGRTLALNLASINIFKELTIWNDLKKNATSYRRMFVWDSKGSSPLEFLAKDIEKAELGSVISVNSILESLRNIVLDSENINLKQETGLTGVEVIDKQIVVSCSNGEKITSKLVVGADGVHSTLRKIANIKTRSWSYDQKAFVAGLKTDKSHQQTAWQIFTPTGPIAFLPFDLLEGSNISLVWSANLDYSKKLESLAKKEFIKELEDKTELILGTIELQTEINSFPLNQLHSRSYSSERIALVGDAAHSFHPLAGQGLNLGISDVACLSRNIIKARRKGIDIGLNRNLKEYERSRKIPNLTMTAMMELFKRGFETSDPWIKFGRNLAFDITSESQILKKRFIKEAAGII